MTEPLQVTSAFVLQNSLGKPFCKADASPRRTITYSDRPPLFFSSKKRLPLLKGGLAESSRPGWFSLIRPTRNSKQRQRENHPAEAAPLLRKERRLVDLG